MRPSLHDIVDHPFFTEGTVPASIPATAHDAAPDFRHITPSVSQSNLKKLRRSTLLDEDQTTSISVPKPPPSSVPGSSAPGMGTQMSARSITSSIAQQEKEFQKAVQPGSPISALLSSARQPLIVGPGAGNVGGENLFRKLQAVNKESPLKKVITAHRPSEEDGIPGAQPRIRDDQDEEARLRKKELESQKARIVAQMAPVREEEEDDGNVDDELENMAPPPVPAGKKEQRPRDTVKAREAENPPRREFFSSLLFRCLSTLSIVPTKNQKPSTTGSSGAMKLHGFDAAAHVLTLAFDAKAAGRVFRDPRADPRAPLPEEKVFLVSWVDYCNKYGMGYALTDGSVGVHFNDTTSCVLSPDKQ